MQPKHTTGKETFLRTGPWKDSRIRRYTLGLHKQPWKELKPSNVVPRGLGRRGSPDSGEAGVGTGREGLGAGSRSSWRSDGGRSWCGVALARGARGQRLGGRRRHNDDEETARPVQQAAGQALA
jgi:hypothetical protein